MTAERTGSSSARTWQNWSWLLPGIWLLFLVYTVVAVLDADLTPALTAVGIGLVAVYALCYLAAFVMLMDRRLRRWRFRGWQWVLFAGLWLCILAQYALIGPLAINMTPFTLSYAAYVFAPRVAWVVAAVTSLGVGWFASRLEPAYFWYIMAILVGVFLICIVMRTLMEAENRTTSYRRHLAVVSERERLARDVHDGLGHTLTVVALKAELAERVMDSDPGRARAELAELRGLTRDALDQVRGTVSGLRATDLPSQVAALEMTLEGAGIDVEVLGDPAAVESRIGDALGPVLREVGTNILRHSRASRCTITFAPGSAEVVDDGVGLGDAPAGNGRRGMAERVAAVGATLRVGDAPQGGTRVAVTW